MADFSHRINSDGTFDSVCYDCYRTVAARKATEAELKPAEDTHICNRDDLRVSRRRTSEYE